MSIQVQCYRQPSKIPKLEDIQQIYRYKHTYKYKTHTNNYINSTGSLTWIAF